jgi:hypothetical protein
MNKPPYVCSTCSRAFTRSWNAQRHIDSIHKGLSNINIKYKSGKTIDALKNQPGFNPSFGPASNSKGLKYLNQKYANDSAFRSYNNGGSPLKKWNRPVMPMDEGQKEDLLYNTLEKMGVPFEKLEKLFFEKPYLLQPSEDVEKKLSFVIITALENPNPVKVIQDNLDHYNRQYHGNKMISYVAKNGRCSTFTATEYLKSKLEDTYSQINH